ncbi:hypothetical protein GPECTOR_13g711 [Gonium pectorale]|uniref:Uncharacterized protein n=1 Tax=Gonium pectorale TaxID=33097 RepID=A0A150GN49_GONPE|nr:hypothetical protein GPECTOR_13g711 [Gonium pectorale]|eukprot:KXZ51224.1 hypothetical protein GPECTOR_13g711 [Gonium pectorale]
MAKLRDSAPEQIRTMVMDVTQEVQVQKIGQETGGRLDVVVNNAGIAALGPTAESDLDVVRRVHEVNFLGTWAVCKAAAKLMIPRRSGVIANIGSFASKVHPPFMAAYNSSKVAVESISHSLRLELAPFRIRVVYVAPTWCRTAILSGSHMPTEGDWQAGHYADIREDVLREAGAPQGPDSWPPSRIAKRIVAAALGRNPPMYVFGGGEHLRLRFLLAVFPRRLIDLVLHYRVGLAKLAGLVRRRDAAGARGGGAAAAATSTVPSKE